MAHQARKRILELSELGGPFRCATPPAVACASCPDYVRRTWKQEQPQGFAFFRPDAGLNQRIYLVQADITRLRVDAVQNAANRSLLGGGGIDGAIHRAAGPQLLAFNRGLKGCETGHAKVAPGFNLPAKYVVHTVGPVGERPNDLRNAYWNTLEAAFNRPLPELPQPAEDRPPAKRREPDPVAGIRSIALCGVSTGIYGYPVVAASHVALNTVRQWLEVPANREKVDAIVFCTFLDSERDIYAELIPYYFPPAVPGEEEQQAAADVAEANAAEQPGQQSELEKEQQQQPIEDKDSSLPQQGPEAVSADEAASAKQ